MSATALPLPLALSQPVPMTTDLNSLLGAGSTTYDPATQMGVHAGSVHTNSSTHKAGLIVVDDVLNDNDIL
jgi:hypothetical protein